MNVSLGMDASLGEETENVDEIEVKQEAHFLSSSYVNKPNFPMISVPPNKVTEMEICETSMPIEKPHATNMEVFEEVCQLGVFDESSDTITVNIVFEFQHKKSLQFKRKDDDLSKKKGDDGFQSVLTHWKNRQLQFSCVLIQSPQALHQIRNGHSCSIYSKGYDQCSFLNGYQTMELCTVVKRPLLRPPPKPPPYSTVTSDHTSSPSMHKKYEQEIFTISEKLQFYHRHDIKSVEKVIAAEDEIEDTYYDDEVVCSIYGEEVIEQLSLDVVLSTLDQQLEQWEERRIKDLVKKHLEFFSYSIPLWTENTTEKGISDNKDKKEEFVFTLANPRPPPEPPPWQQPRPHLTHHHNQRWRRRLKEFFIGISANRWWANMHQCCNSINHK